MSGGHALGAAKLNARLPSFSHVHGTVNSSLLLTDRKILRREQTPETGCSKFDGNKKKNKKK